VPGWQICYTDFSNDQEGTMEDEKIRDYRPTISLEKAEALRIAVAYSLANCDSLTEHHKALLLDFLDKMGSGTFVKEMLKLLKPEPEPVIRDPDAPINETYEEMVERTYYKHHPESTEEEMVIEDTSPTGGITQIRPPEPT